MRYLYSLLIYLLFSTPVYSIPLNGSVHTNVVNPGCLQPCKPQLDKRGKALQGKIKQNVLRGFIGIHYNFQTGEITYIYPESDLNKFNIKAGDFIVKIERELYRPCLMTNVVIYPKDYIMNLTIKGKNGIIRTIPVKLIDARSIIGG